MQNQFKKVHITLTLIKTILTINFLQMAKAGLGVITVMVIKQLILNKNNHNKVNKLNHNNKHNKLKSSLNNNKHHKLNKLNNHNKNLLQAQMNQVQVMTAVLQ